MSEPLGESVLKLTTDQSGLDSGLAQAQSKAEAFGSRAMQVGSVLSVAVTAPIVAMGAMAIKNFNESAQAAAQMESALRSTGGAAGKSAEDLNRMATALEANSLFGDDEIIKKVIANLLTFTNVSGQAFDGAAQAAVNLSARLGQDLQSSAIQVGKALNDPIAGVGALRRVGVQFTESQKDMIEKLVKTGDVAGAQTIILKELETEFGGAAAAAAAAGTGPITQLQIKIGNLTEKWGELILKGLMPVISFLTRVADWMDKLDDRTKTAILVVAALAAALGPLLVAIGAMASGIAALMPVITAVIAILSGPIGIAVAIGAVVAALVAFAARNEKIQSAVASAWKTLKESLGGVLTALGDLFKVVGTSIQEIWTKIGPDVTRTFRMAWEILGPQIKVALDLLLTLIVTALNLIKGAVQTFTGLLTGDWRLMAEGIKTTWSALWEAVKAIVMAPLKAITGSISGFTTAVTDSFKGMYDRIVGHSFVPDLIEGIRAEFGKLGSVMVGPAQSATRSVINSFASMFASVAQGSMSIGQGISGLAKQGGMSLLEKIPGVASLFSAVPGLGQLAGVGVSLLVDAVSQMFGKGRRTANEFVQNIQNPFGDLLGRVKTDEELDAVWAEFNRNANQFAAQGDIQGTVVRQAHEELDPLIARLRNDLPSGMAQTTVNVMTQPGQDEYQIALEVIRVLETEGALRDRVVSLLQPSFA